MRVTMLPKVVVFLACLCAVKAGVLTVNAYEDQYDGIESVYDGADTLDRSVRNCDNTQCNSICRALGFAGGVCISPTVCRCSGRSAREAAPEEVHQEIDQDPEEVVVRTTRTCGASECTAFCKKMGYVRGVCIGNYCQCRSQRASDVSEQEIENPSSDVDPRSAFLDAIRPEENTASDEAMLESSSRRCVNSQCQSACRRRGYARGVCVGINVCRCSGRLVRATEETDNVDQEIENGFADTLDRSVRNCVNSQCNSICRALGFARGVCVSSTVCRCSGRRSLVATYDEPETYDEVYQEIASVNDGADTLDRSVRNCVNSQCNSICRALGFARGVCVSSTVCRCSGRRSSVTTHDEPETYDEAYQEIASVNDGAETLDRSVRNCVNSQCNSICRALGFARGVCVSSTVCRCSGRRSLVTTHDEPETYDAEYQEIASVNDGADTLDRSVRNCVNSQCNSICRALGFARGVCVSSTVCRCSGRRSSVATYDEPETYDEGYQEIASVNDGADTLDRSVRNCVNSQCNSICRALGFARGVCVSSTVCRCSGRRSSVATYDEPETYDEGYQEIASVNDGADTLDRSVRNCVNSQCNSICRALGFAQGVCISPTVCRCSGRRNADVANEEAADDDIYQEIASVNDGADTLDRSVRNCVNSQCNSICRALGFAQGVCISPTVCRCSGRRSSNTAMEANIDMDETPAVNEVDAKKAGCNLRWCEQNCRRMGFPRGACVNGRCKCDLRSSKTENDIAANEIDDVKPAVEEESNDIPQN